MPWNSEAVLRGRWHGWPDARGEGREPAGRGRGRSHHPHADAATLRFGFRANFRENAGFPGVLTAFCSSLFHEGITRRKRDGGEGWGGGAYLPAEAKQVAVLMTMNRQHRWPNFFMSDNTIWLRARRHLFRRCALISMQVPSSPQLIRKGRKHGASLYILLKKCTLKGRGVACPWGALCSMCGVSLKAARYFLIPHIRNFCIKGETRPLFSSTCWKKKRSGIHSINLSDLWWAFHSDESALARSPHV